MATTPTQLSGLFKEVYADRIEQLVPDVAKIVKLIPFVERDKEEGNKYHQPVILSNEHGITYAAAGAGAFALNNAIAMNMGDAQVQGSQMLLRAAMSYDAAAKASNSRKAFVKATELIVENMMESMTKRLEVAMLYGGSTTGLGTVASSANASGTSTVITVTTSQWATGIWAGMENAQIDFYGASVLKNTNAACTITAIDMDNRKLTITGNATDIGVLDTYFSANPNVAVIYFTGAFGNEMTGIDGILTNTGTLFNISAATYSLWKAASHSAASAALTMGKVLTAIAKPIQRGLTEDVLMFTNPIGWGNLNADLSALRRLDGSYDKKKGENGVQGIVYHAQNGDIEIVSHPCVKEGDAFIFPAKKMQRLGAQDLSFKTPGREDEIFLHLPNNAGFELRLYTDQAIFCKAPARCVKITGIVNS
jgi:hypothetical protein